MDLELILSIISTVASLATFICVLLQYKYVKESDREDEEE